MTKPTRAQIQAACYTRAIRARRAQARQDKVADAALFSYLVGLPLIQIVAILVVFL